jgi:hypothetical protein
MPFTVLKLVGAVVSPKVMLDWVPVGVKALVALNDTVYVAEALASAGETATTGVVTDVPKITVVDSAGVSGVTVTLSGEPPGAPSAVTGTTPTVTVSATAGLVPSAVTVTVDPAPTAVVSVRTTARPPEPVTG